MPCITSRCHLPFCWAPAKRLNQDDASEHTDFLPAHRDLGPLAPDAGQRYVESHSGTPLVLLTISTVSGPPWNRLLISASLAGQSQTT
jgi:hypothetical protein